MDMFEVSYGFGMQGGLTIEIGEGPFDRTYKMRRISMRDDAFSLIEPVLRRHASKYSDNSRWGVTEVSAAEWRSTVNDLRVLAERLRVGEAPSISDISWVHTVDLDDDVEIGVEAAHRLFCEPEHIKSAAIFLVEVADWVEDSLQRHDALTVYGV